MAADCKINIVAAKWTSRISGARLLLTTTQFFQSFLRGSRHSTVFILLYIVANCKGEFLGMRVKQTKLFYLPPKFFFGGGEQIATIHLLYKSSLFLFIPLCSLSFFLFSYFFPSSASHGRRFPECDSEHSLRGIPVHVWLVNKVLEVDGLQVDGLIIDVGRSGVGAAALGGCSARGSCRRRRASSGIGDHHHHPG